MNLNKHLKFRADKYFVAVSLLLVATLFSDGLSAASLPAKVNADYRVKASFFPLPIKARISVEALGENVYEAGIRLKSPFFRVDQTERARVEKCRVRLLEIQSRGKRIGAEPWDEQVKVSWPDRMVSYQDDESTDTRYRAPLEPTGFASYFAHQYTAIYRGESKKVLTYTQSKKGWRTGFHFKGGQDSFENIMFDQPVKAIRFLTPRPDMPESDMPNVWYAPERLGAFPLAMAMKLGVFHIAVDLKSVDASPAELQALFAAWGCDRPESAIPPE